jgi:hypothetical protein
MSYGRKSNKLLASLLAAVLAPAAALTTVAVAPNTAEAAVKKARCDVTAVLAAKEGDGTIPKNLAFLESRLQADDFAAYKSFTLVEKKTGKATLTEAATFEFKSGNQLSLSLLDSDDKKLKLHATLLGRDGKASLLSTDYSIVDGGVLVMGGVDYVHKDVTGKLFFAVQCARTG